MVGETADWSYPHMASLQSNTGPYQGLLCVWESLCFVFSQVMSSPWWGDSVGTQHFLFLYVEDGLSSDIEGELYVDDRAHKSTDLVCVEVPIPDKMCFL